MTNLLFEDKNISYKQLEMILQKSGDLGKDEYLIPPSGNQIIVIRIGKKLTQSQKLFLKKPIEDLDLTIKLFNILKSNSIKCIGDLLYQYNNDDIKNIRGWNEKCTINLNDNLIAGGFPPIP